MSKQKRHKRIGWARFMMWHALRGCFTCNTELLQDEQKNDAERRKEQYKQEETTQANWLGEAYDAARFMWMFHVKHKTLEG